MTRTRVRQILVAGIGNSWLRDDGFGGEVAARLAERELPGGVSVFDAGTGGLALAYEVMRGYDALVLVDASRQGGEPGALYVMEVSEEDVEAGIEDGAVLDPHGMDPQTVLRFVRSVGGWPGRVVVVACEPSAGADMGMGLTEPVAAAVGPAVDLVLSTVAELGTDAAYETPAG
jgi:hydrogenase maturation protease